MLACCDAAVLRLPAAWALSWWCPSGVWQGAGWLPCDVRLDDDALCDLDLSNWFKTSAKGRREVS